MTRQKFFKPKDFEGKSHEELQDLFIETEMFVKIAIQECNNEDKLFYSIKKGAIEEALNCLREKELQEQWFHLT